MQRSIIFIGVLLVVVGFAWPWLVKIPLGRLPGDIVIERENFKLYVPLASMLLISAVVSVFLFFFRK